MCANCGEGSRATDSPHAAAAHGRRSRLCGEVGLPVMPGVQPVRCSQPASRRGLWCSRYRPAG